MNEPARFPYIAPSEEHAAALLPYVPITLIHGRAALPLLGLLDTGATVNVLPYSVGVQLGLVWDEHPVQVSLAGNLAQFPARAVTLTGKIATFPPVTLAFAWTRATHIPIILGQVNFFMEFDVCFFRSQRFFEVKPRDVPG